MSTVHAWKCAACGAHEDSAFLPPRWRLRYIRTAHGAYLERTLCGRPSCAQKFGGFESPTQVIDAGNGEKA